MQPTPMLPLSFLCAALGYAVVCLKDNISEENTIESANLYARKIEEFCIFSEQKGSMFGMEGPTSKENMAAIQKMADAIIDILRSRGECRSQDMIGEGFSAVEIERYWSAAYRHARAVLDMKGWTDEA